MSAVRSKREPSLIGRRYLLTVAGYRIPSYTAMLYLGCVAGIYAGAAVARATSVSESRFVLASVVLLVPALIGARLWFVALHLSVFRSRPSLVWRRSAGGSALYGGFLLSFVVSLPLLRVAELPFWRFWDAASVTLLVGLVFTRVGCLMNGCCAGKPTPGRLGLWLPNAHGEWRRRIPTPVLEAGWTIVVLAVCLAARPSLTVGGELFGLLAGGYAVGRSLLEGTRESAVQRRLIDANHLVSVGLLLAAALIFARG